MPGLSAAHAANIVDASVGTAAFVATVGAIHSRLMTANGSATAAGTELATSQGYTAGNGAPTVTFAAASTTTAVALSSTAVTVTMTFAAWPARTRWTATAATMS